MIEVFGSQGMLQSRRQRGVSLYQGDKVVDDGISVAGLPGTEPLT